MSQSELYEGRKVQLADQRTGIIRFSGHTQFAPGLWVGIELDDASGKNDGSVQDHRYFDCPMGHGMFVRPNTLKLLAGPPAPFLPQQANKKARPTSTLSTASSKSTAPPDPGLNRRISVNATSPTPNPKPTRVTSNTRPTNSPIPKLGTAPSIGGPARTASAGRLPTKSPTKQLGSIKQVPKPAGLARPPLAPRARTTSTTTGIKPHIKSPAQQQGTAPPTVGPSRSASTSSTNSTGSVTKPFTKQQTSAKPPAPVATASRPAASTAATNKEVEDLKAKLRILDRKRAEDREKLSSFDKIQAERDRFERIIQTLQTKFQPQQQELADLKRQLKEAESRFQNVERIQEDHDAALEIATLDKEVAEEMAEVYKTELDALRHKVEELDLEVEILREENAEFTKGMAPDEIASVGWLQMEKQNERLRQALTALRDLAQETEEDYQNQIKELRGDLCEIDTLKEQLRISEEGLAQRDATVEHLRDQLDGALGSEAMVESLVDQTRLQSDKIEELTAAISELTELKDIADEMDIIHGQHAKQLQQEIEDRNDVIAEQVRQAAADKKSMEEMEYTLSRFRELVTSLQVDLADMRASQAVTETESEQLNNRSRAMLDLNQKLQISAAKTQVKAIDFALHQMEAQEAKQLLSICNMFLPDSYQDDKNPVLTLLAFKRVAFKANLINDFVKERVNGQPHPGHQDDVFHGCATIDKLTWVASMCDRFVNAISHCTVDKFHGYNFTLYELDPVERTLNAWIDDLKRDELKEERCSDELQRTISLMTHLGEVHMSNDLGSFADDIHMKALLMQSYLESAAVAFTTTASMVQSVIPHNDDDELGQHFSKKTESVITQTRSAKVTATKTARALEALKTRSLVLSPDTLETFEQCETATSELANMSRTIGLDLHQLLHQEGRTDPLTYTEVQACIQKTAMDTFNLSEVDLFSAYTNKLRAITSQLSDLAAISTDLSYTQEFERLSPPWVARSVELKLLKDIPIKAEAETRRLKDELTTIRRTLATREEDFSTAQLKIETLESRMRDAKAKALRISELESEVDSATKQVATLNDALKEQAQELKHVAVSRDEWKRLAKAHRAVPNHIANDDEPTKINQEQAMATAREMDLLRLEITSLQDSVRYLRGDNHRARLIEPPNHEWLAKPLTKKLRFADNDQVTIFSETRDTLAELVNIASKSNIFDMSKLPANKMEWKPASSTPRWHAAKQLEQLEFWKGRRDSALKAFKGKGKSPARD